MRVYAPSGVSPDEPETPARAQPCLGFMCASVYWGGEPQFYCVSDSCIVIFVACQEAGIGTLACFAVIFGFPGGYIPVTGLITHIDQLHTSKGQADAYGFCEEISFLDLQGV